MPAKIIQSFADKSGKSEKEVENLWKKSKLIVKKEYPDVKEDSDKFYEIIVGILKKMLKIDEEADASITTTSMGGANAQHAKHMGLVKRHPCKCDGKNCKCDDNCECKKKKKKNNESFSIRFNKYLKGDL